MTHTTQPAPETELSGRAGRDRVRRQHRIELVSDVMRPCKVQLRPEATLAEAANAMLNCETCEAVIVDERGHLIGTVGAQDLFGTQERTIDRLVRPARAVIAANTSAEEAAILLNNIGCDHAIVVEAGQVVGAIAWDDVADRLPW